MLFNSSVPVTEPSTTMAPEENGVSILPYENEAFDETNSFAVCTMWMDDNHKLIEWIAYNYYALPLRHLVVLRDHASVQNLTSISWTVEGFDDHCGMGQSPHSVPLT